MDRDCLLKYGAVLIVVIVVTVADQDYDENANENEPEFMNAIPNITVAIGRDAQIPCNIDKLGSYKAAWLRVEDKGILTIHEHIITRNYRISLTHSDNRNFVLNIKNVQETDKGGYMCQINTVPMKSQIGFLDVVFPPEILLHESSSDVLVTEGSNVSLHCKAKGYPKPVIKWKREDKKHIPLHNYQGKKYVARNITGEILTITRVTRVHMGAYLCIASNGIPPSVSRRVFLRVQFPPAVWMPTQMIGSSQQQDVTLTCHIDAFPPSVNYWIKDSADIIADDDKYNVHQEEKEYKTHLSLVIKHMEPSDFGSYTCLAKNPLGVQEANVKIFEIPDIQRSGSGARKRQYTDNRIEDDTKQTATKTQYPQNSYNKDDSSYSTSESQISKSVANNRFSIMCFVISIAANVLL